MSKPALKIGERIWIESKSMFYTERTLTEYEVVETNKSSAYVAHINDLDKENPYRIRIEQRARKVVDRGSFGYSYRVWGSKEAFELNVQHQAEFTLMKQQAKEKVEKMSFEQLKSFINS